MTTCRGNRARSCRAYTFLELALALAIVAVVFFSVVPLILASQRERHLRQTMDALAALVRDSRYAAEKLGQPGHLTFGPKGISSSQEGEGLAPVSLAGCQLLLRYPGGKWEKADGRDWNIYSTGLVEPLSVRLEQETAWIETDFDFLTGNVADERYSF